MVYKKGRMDCPILSTSKVPGVTKFLIFASAGVNGSISPSGAIEVVAGSDITFTFTPNAEYECASVEVDGIELNTESDPRITEYVFTDVQSAHTIEAGFLGERVIPIMTSQTTPSGNIYVNRGPLTGAAWPAFDCDSNTSVEHVRPAVTPSFFEIYGVGFPGGQATKIDFNIASISNSAELYVYDAPSGNTLVSAGTLIVGKQTFNMTPWTTNVNIKVTCPATGDSIVIKEIVLRKH